MTHHLKDTFICMDCETTGLDPKSDRVIEVAAVKFTIESNLDSIESLIDPEYHIPESSIEIHHITPDMVVGKPKIAEILPELLAFIGNYPIVGHGVGFDVDVVAIAAERAGIPCTLRHNPTIDTLRMARLYGECPINSLEQLRMHFHIPYEIAHRAMSDVLVNVEVFKRLAKDYRNLPHIFDCLSRPIQMKNMPLGPHKGRPLREVPLEYLRWAAHKDFDQDLMFSIRSELKRRKQGNLFSQASNPFGNL